MSDGRIVSGLMVKGVYNEEWVDLPLCWTNENIPNNVHEAASRHIVSRHDRIAKFADYFPELQRDFEVLLLIGRDCGRAMGTKCLTNHEPWVHETPLGWALAGSTTS